MSNLLAGVMYGHLLQRYTPGQQFEKDDLYGSILGQLLQENLATQYYTSGTDLIDPSSDQQAVMGTGQGGPYQINNYAADMVSGTHAPAGHSLINFVALQPNIGYTLANAATQYERATPASFNDKYYGPMLTAVLHLQRLHRAEPDRQGHGRLDHAVGAAVRRGHRQLHEAAGQLPRHPAQHRLQPGLLRRPRPAVQRAMPPRRRRP